MPYEPPPELATLSLADIAELVAARRLPPVNEWTRAREGDSEMRIAADGRWFHQGGEIARAAMIRTFSSLLLRDTKGQHWLVTPEEKLAIAVEDAAFLAVDVKQEVDGMGRAALVFRLNTDEFVIAGPDHPLIARGSMEAPALYLAVRHGCEARVNRSTWLDLAGMAMTSDESDAEASAVASLGMRFALVLA